MCGARAGRDWGKGRGKEVKMYKAALMLKDEAGIRAEFAEVTLLL